MDYINILIVGEMGSGKSTMARYLKTQCGYNIFSLGEKIHSECKLYKMHDREHLQAYGQMMRQVFGENVWTDYLYDRTKNTEKVIIDDARQLNEYDYFTEKGYLPIAVVTDQDIRIRRLLDRIDYKFNSESLNHDTEVQARECILKCDIKIDNNGTYNDLVREIEEKLVSKIKVGDC